MADFIGYRNKLIFEHVLDNTVVMIIPIGCDTFVWIQYIPTEGGQNVQVMKHYTTKEVRKMVEHLKPYCDGLTAVDLFEKFILNT